MNLQGRPQCRHSCRTAVQFSLSFVPTTPAPGNTLAALMSFGNMGEYGELTALKSSGIPLQRIMRSLIIVIALLVPVSFYFSNYVLLIQTGRRDPAL